MADLPTDLPTSPDAVLARLVRQSIVVRSVWFPTTAELTGWGLSGCPVYLRPLSADRAEIGPRLGSMWASVFSPVLELRLEPTPEGSRAQWHRRYPRFTAGVLVLWAALVVLWGSAIALGLHPGAEPWWAIITASTLAAPAVGWIAGGRALDATIPWVSTVVLAPDEEEDW